ncbi:MAG: DoxX family protein [Salinisphaera sp.]|nr:DoxX family protein [Salinisphaera sp.]MDN5938267.1 DoxX family protein [Salinisphaera sp.]
MKDIGTLLGRVLLAHIFILAGLGQIHGYAGTTDYMIDHGVPIWFLPAVIALELVAGVAVIVGWQTRLASAALAIFCIATAVMFHHEVSQAGLMFMKDLAMAGGFLTLLAHGAGRWSIDHWVDSWSN